MSSSLLRFAFAASVILNLYFLFGKRGTSSPPPTIESVTVGGVTISGGGGSSNGVVENSAETSSPDTAVAGGPPGTVATAGEIVDTEKGLRIMHVAIDKSLAHSFNQAVGSEFGDLVSAVFSRIMMWKLDLKSDIRKGDKIDLVYRVMPDINQVDIQATQYQSLKLNQRISAFWYQPPGQPFGAFYDGNGVEIALSLENSPISGYEQITALLRDRTGHKGMDFKTPVGTAVVAPFRARITRVNWNPANGTCIEMELLDSKLIAKFLHLSKRLSGIDPGRTVGAGESIAESGNTGKSTAPHLHYQLEKANGSAVDPLDFHKTYNNKVAEAHLAEFNKVRDHWIQVLNSRQ